MTNRELAELLRRVRVETGSLMCLSCGYERSCGVHGCAIMNLAADTLGNSERHVEALQKEIEGLRMQLPRWIPVTERLPEVGEPVFAIVSGKPLENVELIGALQLATLYNDGWCVEPWPEWQGAVVTHWMPLPEPPEVET